MATHKPGTVIAVIVEVCDGCQGRPERSMTCFRCHDLGVRYRPLGDEQSLAAAVRSALVDAQDAGSEPAPQITQRVFEFMQELRQKGA